MPEIKLLSEETINKIAAGEVIERPASVVKELLENSLDAGATAIMIEIKNYGQELIRVSDNGCGMSSEDAHQSILRHATSKISSADDLFSIRTLGFRGEALASIAAVSRLTITTKLAEKIEGYKLIINGGIIAASSIAASKQGTTVEVEDLFFNTPARKKFLKSNAVELQHITAVIVNYALLHQTVGFKLIHNAKEMINSPATSDLRSNIASLYGIDIAKEMIEVQHHSPGLELKGMVVKPYFARNDKLWQTILVNGRWVKNEDLTAAVYQAYHSILFVNKHPIFVLRLELNPATIDVNVHPNKSEIKIEQKELVCDAVTKSVREALARHNLLPEVGLETQELQLPPLKRISLPPKYSFDHSQQAVLKTTASSANSINYSAASRNGVDEQSNDLSSEPTFVPLANYLEEFKSHTALPPLRLLGQIHKTFFAAETAGGMFFIDQHAAHERALYEQFMEQYLSEKVSVQNLLQPAVLDVPISEVEIVKENLAELNQLGFEVSEFGRASFIVKTVPAVFDKLPAKEMVQEIVEKWGKQKLTAVKEEIITRMACRSAVMAGEELTIAEMSQILKELSAKKLPFTCPHGRPTMIKVTAEELEKKFRRKG